MAYLIVNKKEKNNVKRRKTEIQQYSIVLVNTKNEGNFALLRVDDGYTAAKISVENKHWGKHHYFANVKVMCQSECGTCSKFLFLHSTNEIIVFCYKTASKDIARKEKCSGGACTSNRTSVTCSECRECGTCFLLITQANLWRFLFVIGVVFFVNSLISQLLTEIRRNGETSLETRYTIVSVVKCHFPSKSFGQTGILGNRITFQLMKQTHCYVHVDLISWPTARKHDRSTSFVQCTSEFRISLVHLSRA